MVVPLGSFESAWLAADRPDLVGRPVAAALAAWANRDLVAEVLVVDTDPEKADTAVFCEAYDTPLSVTVNCVIVGAKRGGDTSFAACVVLASNRVDVNRTARKALDARKASFTSTEVATAESGMEYGGITPIGLPAEWPLLVDEAVVATPYILAGSGLRRGKLIMPGSILESLPNAAVLSGLGV